MRRTALVTLTLTAAAAGLTGCLADEDRTDATSKGPFAGLSGGQILDQAARATADAPSLQVSGQAPDIRTGDTIHFDMALSGKDECSGTLRYTEGKADVTQTDGTVYVRYDKKLLHAQNEGASTEEMDAVVDQLAGKWLKTFAEMPTSTNSHAFATWRRRSETDMCARAQRAARPRPSRARPPSSCGERTGTSRSLHMSPLEARRTSSR